MDQNTAVAMSIADSAVIIKTTDGGQTWQTVYHDETPNIFLDVIEIDPKTGIGIILGDPLN
ncbi:MAG: oxidoreductase, partial [Bacteroidota bacterium]